MKTTEKARLIVEEAKRKLRATSCTFYVQDPLWRDEWRLLFWPGVKHQEPMHGFIFPSSAKRVIVEGEREIFSRDAPADARLRGSPVRLTGLMPRSASRLFGDFIEREQVKSCARLLHVGRNRVDASLFVNFAKTRDFDARVCGELRGLMAALCKLLPLISKEFEESDSKAIRPLLHIMHPSYEISALRLEDEPGRLQQYFTDLLIAALQALHVRTGEGFGTVHLYDPEKQLLTLQASSPSGRYRTRADRLSVQEGQGVISWVALRRRAILIDDLRRSKYGSLHRQIAQQEMRSQVAVPLVAGGEVLGVLNLESATPNRFRREDVRAIWYAANKAAVALQLSRHGSMIRERKKLIDGLFEVFGTFSAEEQEPASSLKKLLQLAQGELRADECEVWPYDTHEAKFGNPVGTYQMLPTKVRTNGWSNFIVRNRCPLWISEIAGEENFRVEFWNRGASEWQGVPLDAASDAPKTINTASVGAGYCCELGIPVLVKGYCTGAAWLKYRNPRAARPSPELMPYAIGFAELGALVSELRGLADRVAGQTAEAEMKECLGFTDGPLTLPGISWLEGYVKRQSPESRLGGDFHATEILDSRHVGILLGDAEGHGVTGVLKMLPLMTAFRLFSRETTSCKHLMVRLDNVASSLQCRGSAVYCIFALEGSGVDCRVQLFASSAGNVELRVLRKEPKSTVECFPDDPRSAKEGLGYIEARLERTEARCELEAGDLVIGFTDGITEAASKAGEQFGHSMIGQIAQSYAKQSPQAIAEAIMEAAASHAGGLLGDDATVLVVRVREKGSGR